MQLHAGPRCKAPIAQHEGAAIANGGDRGNERKRT